VRHVHAPIRPERRSLLKAVGSLGVIECRAARPQIGPSAKGTVSGTGDDDCPHRIVCIRNVECGNHVLHHLRGERIHAVGPVQCDGQNSLADIDADRFKLGQGSSPHCGRHIALAGFSPIEKSAQNILHEDCAATMINELALATEARPMQATTWQG